LYILTISTNPNALEISLLIWLGALAAGFLGSLTGLGGGVVIVPFLTSVFGVDIRYAVGASLVSVIATSAGSASTYIQQGYTNLRLGMFLEVGNPSVNYQVFQGEPRELSSPLAIINSAFSGNPLGIIQFGLLLLIATPVARVFFSVVVFVWQGDLIYSLATLLVLSGLIFSFVSAYL